MRGWVRNSFVIALTAGVFSAPQAMSGDAASPEIVDVAGDGGQLNRDLLKAWIGQEVNDDGKPFLVFDIELASLPANPNPSTAFGLHERISVWFKPTAGLPAGKNFAYVAIVPSGSTAFTSGAGLRLGFTATAGTFETLQDEDSFGTAVTLTGKIITAKLPLTGLAGFTFGADALTALYMNWVLVTKGPANVAGAPDANTVLTVFDRAPNSGNGRDYVSVGAGPAFNISLPSPSVEVPTGGNVTAPILLSNLGSEPLNVSLAVLEGVDGYNVTFEALNVSLPAMSNATANVTIDAYAGAGNSTNVTFWATANGASLNVTLGVIVVPAPVPVPIPGTQNLTGNATANETAGAASSERGIPGFEAALVLTTAAVVSLRRRRHHS